MLRVGVDIGGTFTDVVGLEVDETVYFAKVSSTPDDFARGFLEAVAEVARGRGIDPDKVFEEIELLLHGTTVGTNVLVQMRGAKVGLITTRGHRDALLMMRALRAVGRAPDRQAPARLPPSKAGADRADNLVGLMGPIVVYGDGRANAHDLIGGRLGYHLSVG